MIKRFDYTKSDSAIVSELTLKTLYNEIKGLEASAAPSYVGRELNIEEKGVELAKALGCLDVLIDPETSDDAILGAFRGMEDYFEKEGDCD
jgi:hypothetical protein